MFIRKMACIDEIHARIAVLRIESFGCFAYRAGRAVIHDMPHNKFYIAIHTEEMAVVQSVTEWDENTFKEYVKARKIYLSSKGVTV